MTAGFSSLTPAQAKREIASMRSAARKLRTRECRGFFGQAWIFDFEGQISQAVSLSLCGRGALSLPTTDATEKWGREYCRARLMFVQARTITIGWVTGPTFGKTVRNALLSGLKLCKREAGSNSLSFSGPLSHRVIVSISPMLRAWTRIKCKGCLKLANSFCIAARLL